MNTPAEPVPTEDTSAVTQEQASLQEQPARSNPHRCPRTLSYVADASNHSAFTCMQVRAFETKMTATLWADAHLCPRPFSYHRRSTRTPTRQGVECPVKKLEAILLEQQDYRFFAAHSSLGWSAGERRRFEIKKPFLECGDAAPTTEPQLKGKQVVEECAAVSPAKAPAVIQINPPCTQKPAAKAQKPAAKAKASAPSKIQAAGWQGWPPSRSTASVLMVALALVAMCGSALSGLVDATSLALPGGAQPALSANATGDLDAVAYHPGISFDPISNMADDQSSVLSAGDDLLHGEAVCGELGVRCDAGGPMTEPLHANMLRPTAPDLAGSRLSGRHQNSTEKGLPCTPKSLPRMCYLKLPVPTISSDDSVMSSSLAAGNEASLLACSASFGSPPKESASFAEQVTATAHAAAPSPRSSALISCLFCIPCPIPARQTRTLPQPHAAPLNLRLSRSVWRSARRERPTAPLNSSGTQAARDSALLSAVLVGRRNGRLSSWRKCHLRRKHRARCSSERTAPLTWHCAAGV